MRRVLAPMGQWPGPMNQGPGIAPRGPWIVPDRPRSDGIAPAPRILTGRTLDVVCTKKAREKCALWNAHYTWPVGNENFLITTSSARVPGPIKVIY